jgi:MFS transporter, DHA2 family, multidrug resistance protein
MSRPATATAGWREWVAFATLALPTFVVAIDLFVLLLALPRIATDLNASANEQLWIADMYGLILAAFLVTMGTLADRVGYRRILVVGSTVFGLASIAAAYTSNPETLIAARAVMGVAGACLGPCTLALIAVIFQEPKQRATAFGLWGMTFTLGALLGPVLGGVLLEHYWWGSVFLIGAPVMLSAAIVGSRALPGVRGGGGGMLDPQSVALSLIGILGSVYAVKQIARDGFSALTVVALLAGVLALVQFLRRQRGLANPVLDLAQFRNATVSTCLIGQITFSFVSGGVMLFLALYLQLVHGFSTFEAGLAMVPGMIGGAIGFALGPRLAATIRPSKLIAWGLMVDALVLCALTRVNGHDPSGTTLLIVGFAVMALFGAPMAGLGTMLVVSSAPPEKAGSAGSMAQLANEFGATLGIALLGTLGTAVYRLSVASDIPPGLPAKQHSAIRDSLASASETASQLPSGARSRVLDVARDAFAVGLDTIAALGAAALLIVAGMVAIRLRAVDPFGAAAESAAAGSAGSHAEGETSHLDTDAAPMTTA